MSYKILNKSKSGNFPVITYEEFVDHIVFPMIIKKMTLKCKAHPIIKASMLLWNRKDIDLDLSNILVPITFLGIEISFDWENPQDEILF